MNGRNSTTPSAATSNADASSTRIAASGSASCVTCVPNWLIVSADQSLRKSGCRQRPPLGQRLRIVTSPRQNPGRPEERERQGMHVAVGILGPLEVGDEAVEPTLEADEVLLREARVQEGGLVLLGSRGERFVGRLRSIIAPSAPVSSSGSVSSLRSTNNLATRP